MVSLVQCMLTIVCMLIFSCYAFSKIKLSFFPYLKNPGDEMTNRAFAEVHDDANPENGEDRNDEDVDVGDVWDTWNPEQWKDTQYNPI